MIKIKIFVLHECKYSVWINSSIHLSRCGAASKSTASLDPPSFTSNASTQIVTELHFTCFLNKTYLMQKNKAKTLAWLFIIYFLNFCCCCCCSFVLFCTQDFKVDQWRQQYSVEANILKVLQWSWGLQLYIFYSHSRFLWDTWLKGASCPLRRCFPFPKGRWPYRPWVHAGEVTTLLFCK